MTIKLSSKAEKVISGAIATGNFPNAEAFIEAAILSFFEEQSEQDNIEGWSLEEIRSEINEGNESGYKPYSGIANIIKNT